MGSSPFRSGAAPSSLAGPDAETIMYDPFRIDWSDPAVAARLLAQGLRLPTVGRARIGPEAARGSLGNPAPTPVPQPRSAPPQRRAVTWPRSEDEQGWAPNGTYTPEAVRARAARAGRIYDLLLKRNYSPDMAAALAANIEAESHGNYRQRQHGGGPGYGLIQWEPPRQARFREAFGYPIEKASEADQLDFIGIELAKPQYEYGSARRIARERGAGPQAAAVMNYYERPAERTLSAIDRANLAEAIRRSDSRSNPLPAPSSVQERPRRQGRR